MYYAEKTFDHARVGRTYFRGTTYELDELTGTEIQNLLDQSLMSVVKKKSSKKHSPKVVLEPEGEDQEYDEDSST